MTTSQLLTTVLKIFGPKMAYVWEKADISSKTTNISHHICSILHYTLCIYCLVTKSHLTTYPSDDLANHATPVAVGVHSSIAAVFHQVHFVCESHILGKCRDQVNAVALQLRTSAHGIWVLLRERHKYPLVNGVSDRSLWENWVEASAKLMNIWSQF